MRTARFYLLISVSFSFLLTGCSGMPDIGLQAGQLKQCPDKPNCVCSVDQDTSHFIEPITFNAESYSTAQAQTAMKAVLNERTRTEIQSETEGYLHAVSTSLIFRFKDDVEFLFSAGRVDIRSASRVGHSDFGVNRARIEEIKQAFEQRLTSN